MQALADPFQHDSYVGGFVERGDNDSELRTGFANRELVCGNESTVST